MTEEYKTEANHVVEAPHHFINRKPTSVPLPDTMFVQLGNCTREN